MSSSELENSAAFDLMGEAMRARVSAARQSLSVGVEKYASIGSDRFALISRGDGQKIVFVTKSKTLRAGDAVPMCHEIMDPRFAHYAYPLMSSQLKEDMGTLKDFMVKSRARMGFYRLLTDGKSALELDDLTCVRAIVFAESKSIDQTPQGAHAALSWVLRNERPSFELRLSGDEMSLLAGKRGAAL